ncbi:MAG: hypothetical protein ABI241_00605 [Bacteroidia bacterium]
MKTPDSIMINKLRYHGMVAVEITDNIRGIKYWKLYRKDGKFLYERLELRDIFLTYGI